MTPVSTPTQAPPLTATLTFDKSSPQSAGASIKWTASAADPDGDTLYYRFRIKGPATADTWVIKQSWSTVNTWTWYTSSADIGDTDISVWIRDGHHEPSSSYDLEKVYSDYRVAQTSITKPDLVISKIGGVVLAVTNDVSVAGEYMDIGYTIKNQGNAVAGPSYTGVYVDGSYTKKDYVGSLAPGAELFKMIDFTCDCTPGETAEIKACADITYQVDESDEMNNCRTGSIICLSGTPIQ